MEFVTTLFGIFGYLLFLSICYLCFRHSAAVLGSKLNITACLAFPLAVICTLQVYLTYFTGFYSKPSLKYWLLLCLYIIITAVIESISTRFVNIKKYSTIKSDIHIYEMGSVMNIVITIFIIYACYDSYQMVSTMDLSIILQDDFQDDFGASAGGSFYARVFLMIMATYYLGYGKDWKSILLGLLCFFPSLIINTKGVIFIPIIAAFIVRYLNGYIKNVSRTLINIGLIGSVIFFSSYMWEFITYGENPLTDSYRWQYIGEKLLYYLTSGVQGFSSNLNTLDSVTYFNKAENITIAPFANFLSKFGVMESVRPISERIQMIGKMPLYGQCDTNVATYIGTIYLYNNFFCGLILHSFWVAVTTVIRVKAIKYRQPFSVCLFALFATVYVLGWFDFYFMQTFWVYMIVMVLILNVFNKLVVVK